MVFNSFVFAGFFVIVYTLYLLFRKHHRIQNSILLIASLIFYGYWNWYLLLLLLASKTINYFLANQIPRANQQKQKDRLLWVAILFNLTLLGFFKYFNFFAQSFTKILHLAGFQADWTTLNIILPIGISFYTFQLMAYVIDVYRGKIQTIHNFLDYVLFFTFFPQLVAGPIERSTDLAPQIMAPRQITATQIDAGLFLILWGYFKKVVIADNLANTANLVFNNYTDYRGLDLMIGTLAFTLQIYGDFSGYTDIARGIAKLMGFELTLNFRLPYFALNPSDFWSRWHISLSTWLRDYLYIPLGGNRHGVLKTHRNLFLTMLLGGLWHGAAWNFVIWGGYQGLILILYRIFDRYPEHEDPWSGKYSYVRVLSKMALMFILTCVGWIIFRSHSLHQIGYILVHLSFLGSPASLSLLTPLLFFGLPLLAVQLYQYVTNDLLILTRLRPLFRIPIYGAMMIGICIFGVRESGEFIYFQF